MELELHQLDLRYEALRKRSPRRERHLIASLAEIGQQLPIVVVSGGDGGRRIVVDGYKRIRALKRLAQDTVRATVWEVEEAEALLLDRLMRTAESEGALEQGWLLRELRLRFSLSHEVLARRFDKSQSWVSRRLALVEELPVELQEHVRQGAIAAHAAMKCLVPMARANPEAARRLAVAIAPLKLPTRQVGALVSGWKSGDDEAKERLLASPELYLRAMEAARTAEKSPAEQLTANLDALSGIARRTTRLLGEGLWRRLSLAEREEASRCVGQAQADAKRLFHRLEKEAQDARPEYAGGDPHAA